MTEKTGLLLMLPEEIVIRAVSKSITLSKEHDLVFGAGDYYQAYLFALFHRSLQGASVVGAGCMKLKSKTLLGAVDGLAV